LSMSTVIYERGFSKITPIKEELRNKLGKLIQYYNLIFR